MKCYQIAAAYFETELAQMQAYTSGEASHDHAKISIRVEDHHILPVLHIFADIDVDLDVYLACLFRDWYNVRWQRSDNIRQAQCEIVGASSVGLRAGYASARSKRSFDFFMSNGGTVTRTGDNKVYISMILLLRGFMWNADVFEKRSETWQETGFE